MDERQIFFAPSVPTRNSTKNYQNYLYIVVSKNYRFQSKTKDIAIMMDTANDITFRYDEYDEEARRPSVSMALLQVVASLQMVALLQVQVALLQVASTIA